jgi:hypothetical protein
MIEETHFPYMAQTWVRIASSVQSCAASLLEAKARLEFDALDCRR